MYLKLNFLNENISYDVYGKSGEFSDNSDHHVITYDNKDSVEICWMGSNEFYSKVFYIDVIIMENYFIIGYEEK